MTLPNNHVVSDTGHTSDHNAIATQVNTNTADIATNTAAVATNTAAIVANKGLPVAPTGATQPTRYVGRWAATGAPASGTFAVGDFGFDGTNAVQICTVAGTPGTWVGSAASVTTGVNPTTHVFDVIGYGAKADAVTLSDGAMAATTALTSASAGFTAADVGKQVVVNNALGAGVHLYTTISAYVSATQVTLANTASATVTAATFTYGTNDLTAWNAALAAVPAGGTVQAPPTPSLVYGAVTVPTPCTIRGTGVATLFGPFSSSGSVVMPTVAPYLTGSVLVQAQSGQDGFNGTIVGKAVNFENVGVYFAGMFKSTGHGFNFGSTNLGAPGYDQGLCGASWRNLYVYGNDGTHYGYYLQNPLLDTLTNTQVYGGGGYQLDANSNQNPYGNCTLVAPYHCGITGTAHGFNLSTTFGNQINLISMERPQSIGGNTYIGTTFTAYSLGSWTGKNYSGGNANNVSMFGHDMENSDCVIGQRFSAFGSGLITINGALDAAPFNRRLQNRRMNGDGSFSLDALESNGTRLWLVNNIVNGTKFEFSTDGTDTLYVPGRTIYSGSGPAAPTAGAALGTSPPALRLSGTDVVGTLIFGTGTATTTGIICTATFNRAYTQPPVVTLNGNNAATAALGLYAVATTTGFTVRCATAPAASQVAGTFSVSYTALGAPAQPTAPNVSDSFNRADSAVSLGTADTGQTWTAIEGTLGIQTNLAYVVTSAGTATAVIDSTRADCQIDCDFPTLGTTSPGIVFRLTDASNLLIATRSTLVKRVAGSYTTLATFTTQNSGAHMTVVLSGSSIVVKNGSGTQLAAVTETFNQTATKHGIRDDTTGTTRFDNFAAG